ncbi:MAG: hypothetical protein OHK0052_26850 [Anaerolineales bacterium]
MALIRRISESNFVKIVVALIGAIAVIWAAYAGISKVSEPASNQDFTLLVQDAENNGAPIALASVSLFLPGRPPVIATTDTRGFAIFSIESAYFEQAARLVIEKAGYQRTEFIITLTEKAAPYPVLLEKEP